MLLRYTRAPFEVCENINIHASRGALDGFVFEFYTFQHVCIGFKFPCIELGARLKISRLLL